jgi:hypothetical protein
MTLVAA